MKRTVAAALCALMICALCLTVLPKKAHAAPDTAPVFTTHPQPQMETTGQPVTFSAAATGSPAPTYQWQVSVNYGSTWSNVTDGTGADTNTYTTPNTTAAMNRWLYRCLASNSVQRNVTSNSAALATLASAYDITFVSTSLDESNPPTIDFGTLALGYTENARVVLVENIGASHIWLVNPAQTGRFTIGLWGTTNWSDPLPPSLFRGITIQPEAGLPVGTYNTTITLNTKDALDGNPTPATLTLQIKLTVTSPAPAIDFGTGTEFTDAATKTIDFGTVPQGYAQPTAKNVVILNTGNISVKLKAPGFDPSAQTSNYAVTQGYGWGNELIVGNARYFSIQPNASLPAGSYDANVTIGCTDVNNNPTAATCTMHVKFTVTAATIPTVDVTPARSFLQGNAPALRLTVGHGITGFDVNNLLSVTVMVNGASFPLAQGTHYDASTGSICIDLYPAWLNTLAPGVYPVDILLQGGAYAGMHVPTSIEVLAPGGDLGADVPKTGDGAPLGLLASLALLSGAGLTVSAAGKRRAAKRR